MENGFTTDLLKTINESEDAQSYDVEVNISGWDRVNRTVNEIRRRVSEASTEEQFQSIGLLCRDVIISLAQEIYDNENILQLMEQIQVIRMRNECLRHISKLDLEVHQKRLFEDMPNQLWH